jgi:hypothetical protein
MRLKKRAVFRANGRSLDVGKCATDCTDKVIKLPKWWYGSGTVFGPSMPSRERIDRVARKRNKTLEERAKPKVSVKS